MGLKSFEPIRDLPDLTGKVAIVTGANTGIGYYTALSLVRKGAKVYMAARNEAKATEAIKNMESEGFGPGDGSIQWWKLDLAQPKFAEESAAEFLKKETRLDILVNNAALLPSLDHKTEPVNGISESMIVNLLSPFVWTLNLLPLMKKTAEEPEADVRIVNVSSDAMQMLGGGTQFKTKEDFNKTYDKEYIKLQQILKVYGHSKLAGALFFAELQRRLDKENSTVLSISIHPGGILTDYNSKQIQNLPFGSVLFWLAKKFMPTAADGGAYNSLFAAAAPQVRKEADKYKGRYLHPVGRIVHEDYGGVTKDSRNPELAQELWETTEKLLSNEFSISVTF